MADLIDNVNESMDIEQVEQTDEYVQDYQPIGEAKIPVSKKYGALWKSRMKVAMKKLEDDGDLERWATAIRYYRNDHSRQSRLDDEGNARNDSASMTSTGQETENIVFANTTALLPALYAKEPSIEISPENRLNNEELDAFCTSSERLLKKLFTSRTAPGINLKRIMRKASLLALLTNYAYLQVGYTRKEDSSQKHVEDLNKAIKMFKDAKNVNEIKEAEGMLMAAEEAIDLFEPEGCFVKLHPPGHVLFDGDAEDRASDSPWMMIKDYLSTDFLKAAFGRKKDGEDGQRASWESTYQPTHVLKLAEDNDVDDTFAIFDHKRSYKDYGFEDEISYTKAQRTCVWYVFDKVTRRVFLYNDADWTYPLWVWDDPYQLPQFFNIVELSFYEDPLNQNGRSEVNMYLDHQDAINEINNEFAKVRKYISGKVVYNRNTLKDPALLDALVAGTNNATSVGLDLPMDADLNKLIMPLMPPSSAALNTAVYDKSRAMGAIDRLSSVTPVLQGVEFKTNTTNKAIESYQSSTQTRLDEKIDAIEDCIGMIGEILLWYCARLMPAEVIESLLDEPDAQTFINNRHLIGQKYNAFPVRVVGGSTQKPTSAIKKQQALQISQVVGQFASASPAAVIVILRMLQRAFDDFSISKEDWEFIKESIMVQQQRGNNSPDGGAQQQSSSGEESGGPSPEQAEQLQQLIQSMPPEAQDAISQLIDEGMSPMDAVKAVAEQIGM